MQIEEATKLEQKVWVVTTSSGHKYLWNSEQESSIRKAPSDAHSLKPGLNAEQSKEPIEEEGSGSQAQLGSGCIQQYEFVSLPKVESFPATDPITKEVSLSPSCSGWINVCLPKAFCCLQYKEWGRSGSVPSYNVCHCSHLVLRQYDKKLGKVFAVEKVYAWSPNKKLLHVGSQADHNSWF